MSLPQIRITSRTLFADGRAFGDVGPYERLDGTLELAVDPAHPANAGIVDLDLAPRDRRGMVACSADVSILAPADPERGNGRVLFDVLNRGKRRALKYFNAAGEDEDPAAHLDPGNGFLMRHGYTVAWCGWQYDVPDTPGLLRLGAPDAVTREGAPISGRIMVSYLPNVPATVQPLAHAGHRPYPAMDVDEPDALLLERDYEDAEPRTVPRDRWSFARVESGAVVPDACHVHFPEGFKPGKTYQFVYTTVGAPVVGLGLVAVRDFVSFLKHGGAGEGNPCAGTLDYAYGFGASQSGRFLRLFLYLGLNRDEADRTVFDGVIPHIAGGRRGEFNQRFGQPSNTEKRSAGCLFPFTDGDQTDPDTGVTDGLLSRLAASGSMPKVMLTNSSSEYWRGDGSLVHTDMHASRDIPSGDTVRVYHFAGTQHASGIYPPHRPDPGGRVPRPAAVQLRRLHALASRRPGEPGPLGCVGCRAAGQPSSVHRRGDRGQAGGDSYSLRRHTRRGVSRPYPLPVQAGLRSGSGKGGTFQGAGACWGGLPRVGLGSRRGRQRDCRRPPSRRCRAPGHLRRVEPEASGHRRLRPGHGHTGPLRLHHTFPLHRGGAAGQK